MGDYRRYKKIEEVIIIFAKLISGTLRRAPNKVTYNGKTIFNPPEDILLSLGYLPVTYTDMPADASEGQYYESSWSQTDTEIVQLWTLVDDTVMPEPEPTISDLENAIKEAINSDN